MEEHLEALAADPDAPDRDERIAALVECPQPLAPLLAARMRARGAGARGGRCSRHGAPLLPRPAGCRRSPRRRWRAVVLSAGTATRGPRRHLATAFVELPSCGRGARARGLGGRRSAASSRWPTSTRDRATAQPPDELARGCGRRSRRSAAAAVDRMVFAVAEPARGRGMSAVDPFTFRRDRRRLVEEDAPARPPPDDGRAPAPLAPRGVRPRAAASAEDVYLFRGVARQPEGRAPVRARRGARPDPRARRRRARLRAARAGAGAGRGARGDASLPGAPRAAPAAAVEPSPALRLADDRVRARGDPRPDRALPARPAASASRWSSCAGPDARGGERRERELRFFSAHRTRRGGGGRRSADPAAAAARRGRAADRAGRRRGPCIPPSSSSCSPPRTATGTTGAGPPGLRRARPRRGRPARAVDRPRRQRGQRRRGAGEQLHRSLSRGHATRGPARRPYARAGLAGRTGVHPDHRRARSRRGAGRAGRVVRAVGRRQDRDGLRHREHGLDRRGAAPNHRVHPARAARSTSS